MARKFEDYNSLVKEDGLVTDKDVTVGGALSVTGALTATGGTAGAVAATTLTSSGVTTLKYPKYIGAVADYDAQAAVLNSMTGASSLTTPTGAQITTAFGDVTGTTIDVFYHNRGNQTSTVTAGDGAVSVKGTAAITTTKTAILRFVNVSTGAWNCYVIAAA